MVELFRGASVLVLKRAPWQSEDKLRYEAIDFTGHSSVGPSVIGKISIFGGVFFPTSGF